MPKVIAALIASVLSLSAARPARQDTYRVDPARSRATIHVGKTGMFSFVAGHTHDVAGPIQNGSVDVDLDAPSRSRVRLRIAAAELEVSPTGEPEGDTPKVQEAMDSDKVLDVTRFPRITYESTAITIKGRDGSQLDAIVTGQLTIRAVTRPVTVPVHVELAGGELTAHGHFAIKQSAFGIQPISVGGVVAVKDTLEIDFSISANRR